MPCTPSGKTATKLSFSSRRSAFSGQARTAPTRFMNTPANGMSSVRVQLDATGYKYVQHKNKFGQDYTSATGDRY